MNSSLSRTKVGVERIIAVEITALEKAIRVEREGEGESTWKGRQGLVYVMSTHPLDLG